MSIVQFAENELNIFIKNIEDKPLEDYIEEDYIETVEDAARAKALEREAAELAKKNVMELIKVVDSQGHSGSSIGFVMSLFKTLVRYRPLTALTGSEEEWEDVSDFYGNKANIQQNKRCPSVFRVCNDNATAYNAYNVDGKVFSDDDGETWFSCSASKTPVTFPYDVPETEKIILHSQEEVDKLFESTEEAENE